MRHIRVIYPGKTKEGFIRSGIDKYLRLLKPYARMELIEVKAGTGTPSLVIKEESERLLRAVEPPFYLLDRDGKELSSEEFAEVLSGLSRIDFVIGGAFGVSDELKASASLRLSLSRLTFTHELSRLILLEQLYRAMTIIEGRKYHY